jgi:VWFA-related protein
MHKEPERALGISMREQSEDAFNAFSQIAKATGGIVDSSQTPIAAFKNAINAAQSYYILYYSPADSKKDGKFKSIKVEVKNKDYKVTHRVGYFTK